MVCANWQTGYGLSKLAMVVQTLCSTKSVDLVACFVQYGRAFALEDTIVFLLHEQTNSITLN